MSIGQWLRYYNFLVVLKQRYDYLGPQFLQATLDLETSIITGRGATGVATALTEQYNLSSEVQLQIESFYLFSKILLDRTADSFGYCFSSPYTGHGSTFSKMDREFDRVCRNKVLLNGVELKNQMSWLQKHVVEYRNLHIEHVKEPRLVHAIAWGANKQVKISPNVIYPSESDMGNIHSGTAFATPTMNLEDLFDKLDEYLTGLSKFFEDNSEKICRH